MRESVHERSDLQPERRDVVCCRDGFIVRLELASVLASIWLCFCRLGLSLVERSRQTTGRVSAPYKKSFQIVHVCLKSFGHTAERPPPKRPSAGPITTHAIGAASATIAAHPPRLNPPSQCYDGRRRAPQAAGGRHERQGGQNSGQGAQGRRSAYCVPQGCPRYTVYLRWFGFATCIRTFAYVPDPVILRCTICLLYTSPSPRDATLSRMPSSA